VCCSIMRYVIFKWWLQCAAMCCSQLQCVALLCSVLQSFALFSNAMQFSLQCVVVCCSLLQCVAVFIAVCISKRLPRICCLWPVFQGVRGCVAVAYSVCCSVLQCVLQ